MTTARPPWWAWTWPLAAWLVLLAFWLIGSSGALAALADAVLIATVFAAAYHAEVVAHRTGEPFGTLGIALAVTVIECALIVSVMLAAPADNAGLARDTIFAAVMIVCNGIVGVCLLWGGARHREQAFQLQGGSERGAGRARRPHGADADPAQCGDERTRSALQHAAGSSSPARYRSRSTAPS